jgi:hypothetical protein
MKIPKGFKDRIVRCMMYFLSIFGVSFFASYNDAAKTKLHPICVS